MPPLKKYTFKHLTDEKVSIEIMDYDFESAYFKLIKITKNPADYKCISI